MKISREMQAFDVYLRNRWIDTVYFDRDATAGEVKQSLIEHEGMASWIVVVRRKVKR